jgi:hypothetical protein
MELRQAAGYFNTVPIDGYTGAAWVSSIASGDFLTYDRFLGPRTFGHLQRMFHIEGDGAAVTPYEVVRTPDGKIYLVASYNHDFRGTEAYATSFLFQEAFYSVGIVDMQTIPAPSGLGGTLNPVVTHTYYGHMERYTSEASTEVDTVRYGTHVIQLPLSALAVVDTDSELLIDDIYFEVKEVTRVLNTTEVRAMERGTGV